jgi:hypothetical protein
MNGRPAYGLGDPVDGGGEDTDQAAQSDRDQIASPDHGAYRLLVPTEPARRVRYREKQRREGQASRSHPDYPGQDECHARRPGQ